jgi:hypothetical protein
MIYKFYCLLTVTFYLKLPNIFEEVQGPWRKQADAAILLQKWLLKDFIILFMAHIDTKGMINRV